MKTILSIFERFYLSERKMETTLSILKEFYSSEGMVA